jgi:hypothetical protein
MTTPIIPIEDPDESVIDLINEQADAIDILCEQVAILRTMRDDVQSDLIKLVHQNSEALKRIADLEKQLATALGKQAITSWEPVPDMYPSDPLPRGMRLPAGFRVV